MIRTSEHAALHADYDQLRVDAQDVIAAIEATLHDPEACGQDYENALANASFALQTALRGGVRG